MSDYDRVARAIAYIEVTLEQQPTLEEVSLHVGLSASHFQRIFQHWAGISPKRFLQLLTTEKAKIPLRKGQNSILDIAYSLGLSSSSRVYDHIVSLEAVTPSEYASLGANVRISYGLASSPYGATFIASSSRGVMHLSFLDDDLHSLEACLVRLKQAWPNAVCVRDDGSASLLADAIFGSTCIDREENSGAIPISLWVKGTNFQVAVWRALMSLCYAESSSYTDIATRIGKPKAVRAVATAIANNPLAQVIPCHRVLRQSGALGGYRWGLERKKMMLLRERLAVVQTG